ncbi:MAG: hypothetical protein E6J61_16510 [Deltaproteobacteria bacterium]|nr:MAG: hypothetical protein E6J61_16510 [Deltaproteobacteria bacterium]
MRTQLNSLILAAFAVSTLGGCIVQREVVREDPQAALPTPPPPPSDEADAQPYAPVAAPEPVSGEVDEQVFVDRLSPYGRWEYVPDYGRVWVPAAAVGWRPYWDGHWVLTEWGWTFVSDDPWGWATYHYAIRARSRPSYSARSLCRRRAAVPRRASTSGLPSPRWRRQRVSRSVR